jgi:hypothetical protein
MLQHMHKCLIRANTLVGAFSTPVSAGLIETSDKSRYNANHSFLNFELSHAKAAVVVFIVGYAAWPGIG